MPWSCSHCGVEIADSEGSCIDCGAEKSVWSLVPDRTREFTIKGARLECLRGQEHGATPSSAPLYDPHGLVPTTVARVLSKGDAQALVEQGQQPASYDVLVVRLHPKSDVGQVDLAVDFAVADPAEHRFDVPASPYVDVPFVFVAGSESLSAGFGFAGAHVVDVTEDTEEGYAPDVEVKALGKGPIELTTEWASVEAGKLTLLRGQLTEPAAAGDPALAEDELVPAEVAYVLPFAHALELSDRGLLPASEHVLTCRVEPAGGASTDLQLVIELEDKDPYEGSVDSQHAHAVEQHLDYRLVFVHGPHVDPRELKFPGVVAVNVTEGEDAGFAGGLSFSAVGQGPLQLPTEAVELDAVLDVIELEDVSFGTDREIFLPAHRFDPEADPAARVGGLEVIRAVFEFAEHYPGKQLLVAGHTDTTGSDAHNDALSADRARNAHLYLTGQAEAWAAHCQEHFERSDFKAILLWVHHTLGWDTDPGPINDEWFEEPRVARDRFRERFNETRGGSLKRHVEQNVADWLAFFQLYDEMLASMLGTNAAGLAKRREALRFTEPATLACGERWPVEAAGQDGVASRTNRRVDFLFFDPEEVPDLSAEPTGVEVYGPERRYTPRYLFSLLRIRLLDPSNRPMAGAPYRFECGHHTFQGFADREGFATALALQVPQRGVIEWGRPGGFDGEGLPESFAQVRDLYLVPEDDHHGRLHNLGYAVEQDSDAGVRAFQEEYAERFGLQATGTVDGATAEAVLVVHDQSDPALRED